MLRGYVCEKAGLYSSDLVRCTRKSDDPTEKNSARGGDCVKVVLGVDFEPQT